MVEASSIEPFNQGPHLAAAFLCEKVLREADGVVSAIRIVDRVNHTVVGPNPPEEMEPFDYEFTLFISFKAGSARGPMALEIRAQKPSGTSSSPFRQTVNFEGDDERGVNVIGSLKLRLDMAGLHWFDVFLDGHRVTRIPLRVVYLPQITQAANPGRGPA